MLYVVSAIRIVSAICIVSAIYAVSAFNIRDKEFVSNSKQLLTRANRIISTSNEKNVDTLYYIILDNL